MKKKLKNVTLVVITSIDFENTLYALWRSTRKIEFGSVKFIGPVKPKDLPEWIDFEQTHDSKLDSIYSYSHYCIYNLWRHINTEFCLIIHADGYIIHPNAWKDEFLDWDYIGAPWRIRNDSYIDPFGNHQRVGNGGFSIRSQKILKLPLIDLIEWNVNEGSFYKHMNANNFAEDGNICVHNRHVFESHGCKFAPLSVALDFSVEQKVPEFNNQLTFGFHKTLPSTQEKIIDLLYRIRFLMHRRIGF